MFLTDNDIDKWRATWLRTEGGDPAAPLRNNLKRNGLWRQSQVAGRNWPMGCVALEITQRCNLDCTLCYLSPMSEAVRNLPLDEIFRRIDNIRSRYGPGIPVQVTGGDPTLRNRGELVRIVKRIADRGLVPALFTNGIRATRELLGELAAVGLVDVAFHVDMTQERNGFASETALNKVHLEYIERARGLPLSVIFNTTVFRGNFDEIPDLARFFKSHADVVDMAAFQLQADTGRGTLRARDKTISQDTVVKKIREGAGTALNFDTVTLGHPDCNKYATCIETGGTLYDLLDDAALIHGLFEAAASFTFDRRSRWKALCTIFAVGIRRPGQIGPCLRFAVRKIRAMRRDLWKARGRVHKLSFFVHNFMDAAKLERSRCESCVFMAATGEGLISMCVHNAKRDQFILRSGRVKTPDGPAPILPLKRLKGRARAAALAQKTKSASV
ncbi:MAG: radical SAM protein [Sphingomonadales bacterium]